MNYTIANETLKATFSAVGAELRSLQQLEDNFEYMWQADPAFWGRTAPILFPIVGKLKDDTYRYAGKSYQMSQHGFARDQTFAVTYQSNEEIHFLLTENQATRTSYPFSFELHVKYKLEQKTLTTKFEINNTDAVALPFSIGGHPAFRCPHLPNYERKDYSLKFDTPENTTVSFLTNGVFAGSQTDFKGDTIAITDHLFDRDAWVFEDLKSKQVTLVEPNQTPILSVSFDGFPYLGIWSKNQHSPFVCIEPWQGLADTADHTQEIEAKKGIVLLPPGKSYSGKYLIVTRG